MTFCRAGLAVTHGHGTRSCPGAQRPGQLAPDQGKEELLTLVSATYRVNYMIIDLVGGNGAVKRPQGSQGCDHGPWEHLAVRQCSVTSTGVERYYGSCFDVLR